MPGPASGHPTPVWRTSRAGDTPSLEIAGCEGRDSGVPCMPGRTINPKISPHGAETDRGVRGFHAPTLPPRVEVATEFGPARGPGRAAAAGRMPGGRPRPRGPRRHIGTAG